MESWRQCGCQPRHLDAPAVRLYLNRCDVPDDTPEMNLFLRYIGTLSGLKAYRTGWSIYGDDERLAGSIDFVAEDANGDLVLFD